MSDDAGSQSLFVVLRYEGRKPYLCSIVQLDKPEQSDPDPEEEPPVPSSDPEEKPPVRFVDGKWVAHFTVQHESPPIDTWVFSPPSASSAAAGDLYILPDWSYDDFLAGNDENDLAQVQLYGAKFNCTSKSLQQPIEPNVIFKFGGIAVTVGLDVYFMTHPGSIGKPPFDADHAWIFERYNPADDSWEMLDPFPKALACLGPCSAFVAFAVWDDHTILFNVSHLQIWAYNVSNRRWYRVHVNKYGYSQCYAITGQAFVVQNTIYALSVPFDSVVALSIEKNQVAGGRLEYRCSLISECFVPPLSADIESISGSGDNCLARLGEDNLCVVRSCDHVDYKPILVTYIKLMREEGKMHVTNQCIYRFEVLPVKFHIELCFSLPKCMTTTASSELCSTFILNPLGVIEEDSGPVFNTQATVYNFDPKSVQSYLMQHLKKKRKMSMNVDDEEATSGPVNNSSQTKITDEQDFDPESVRSYLMKQKMSEINKETTILNMLKVLDQKLDNVTHHMLFTQFQVLSQPSQTSFVQRPSAPAALDDRCKVSSVRL